MACFVLAFAALGSFSGLSHGKGKKKQEAKELFKEGVDLFEKGDYADALEKFKESFEIKHHWPVRYNMGLCYLELGQTPEGAMQLALYLEEGGDDVKSSVAKEINARLMDLLPELGTVVIYGELEGVTVRINGEDKAGPTMKGELYTPHGTFELTLLRRGKELFTRELTIERGEIKEVDMDEEIEREGKNQADAGTAEENKEGSGGLDTGDVSKEEGPDAAEGGGGKPEKSPKQKRTWLWVAVGIAGGALAGGMATGILAVQERDAMRSDEEKYRRLEGTASESQLLSIWKSRNEHYDKGRACAISTTVLLSVGAAAGIAGIVLLALSGKKAEAKKEGGEGVEEEDGKASFIFIPAPAGGTFTVVY